MDNKLSCKKWRENNKEKRAEYMKKYREKNREKLIQYDKNYRLTEIGLKRERIKNWKTSGIISEDYDKLYEYYLSVNECENCGIELNQDDPTRKCLDHDHSTGLFRNILCNYCNLLRG